MEDMIIRVGDKAVKRGKMIGLNVYQYDAWEPSSLSGPHGTITRIDGEWYGDIATRRVTPDLAALPAMSAERYEKVSQYQRENQGEARALILRAFPEARGGQVEGSGIILRL